jgi:hypothetical protein
VRAIPHVVADSAAGRDERSIGVDEHRIVRVHSAGAREGLHDSAVGIDELDRRCSDQRWIVTGIDAVAADDQNAVRDLRLRRSEIDRSLRSERETATLVGREILLDLIDRIRCLVREISECHFLPREMRCGAAVKR